jgi:predicted transcriptional regulator
MILRAANRGASMSRIMYEVYLSSRPLKQYLSFLQERGFLIYDESTRLYKISERGLAFLQACEQIEDIITIDDDDEPRRAAPRAESSLLED